MECKQGQSVYTYLCVYFFLGPLKFGPWRVVDYQVGHCPTTTWSLPSLLLPSMFPNLPSLCFLSFSFIKYINLLIPSYPRTHRYQFSLTSPNPMYAFIDLTLSSLSVFLIDMVEVEYTLQDQSLSSCR